MTETLSPSCSSRVRSTNSNPIGDQQRLVPTLHLRMVGVEAGEKVGDGRTGGQVECTVAGAG